MADSTEKEPPCPGADDVAKGKPDAAQDGQDLNQNQQQLILTQEDKQKLKAKIDSKVGTAQIKIEFIDYSKINILYGLENIAKNTSAEPQEPAQETSKEEEKQVDDNTTSEPPSKRSKKNNKRGMNKKRPIREKRIDASLRLCPKLFKGETCKFGEKCIFSHDIAKLVQDKPPDLGPVCYNFDTYGKCTRGVMCRYGSAHISADYQNIVDEEKWARHQNDSVTSNELPKDLRSLLWKRKAKFPKSEKYFVEMAKAAKERRERQKLQEKKSHHPAVEIKIAGSSGEPVVSGVTLGSKVSVSEPDQTLVPTEITSSSTTNNVQSCQEVESSSEVVNQELPPGTTDKPQNVTQSSNAASSHVVSQASSTGPTDQSQKVAQSCDATSSQGDNLPKQQETSNPPQTVTSGAVTDEDMIKLRRCEKKAVDFNDKLYLAPLTTVGNLPFRRLCKRFGADITCGEMAICTNLLQAQASEWALLKRHSSEDVFGVQIAGAFPDTMTKCAEILNEHISVDFVDVNVGCPIELVYNKGFGCGLMNRVGKFEEIVRGMDTVLDVPVTVKMRTGVYDKHLTAARLIPRVFNWGAAAVTLHGRTREQRYTKDANWDYIGDCVRAAHPYPLLGNGDILSYEDANEFKEKSGVAGVMIARGALVKPWIFTEIKEQRHWDISSQERYNILQDYVNYGLEHWGSDTEGVEKTRRFLLEWLSFLHRYIPVGVLESVPQKINLRPPHYIGRNDLETLMASANCNDWIKISEMLLGPVPGSFQFLPKHKANSYS